MSAPTCYAAVLPLLRAAWQLEILGHAHLAPPCSQLWNTGWLAVSKHDVRLLWRFLTSREWRDLDLWPFNLKTGITLAHALKNVYVKFDLSAFVFELGARTGQTGEIDRRTDGRPSRVVRPVLHYLEKWLLKVREGEIALYWLCHWLSSTIGCYRQLSVTTIFISS